ncbi:(deoxy)nucleoside triphosphate pyrophosphohydrolase [Butyrivibrio sp. FC2001]|uniref:(deoxy)nucleoside triphosphate pyrophosphohydrolase n=1 Tax=Butyrivibrio sp. FC2001 TaxID=1280671 RepID=UPI000412713F|nr:(deoxy)nucleoside triphosphate pyrophosphohydrolase [Butyrivibrio sp. FC2001]
MKTVKVVAAVIYKEGKVYATQRGYGEFKDGWEFPGGKIEEGETPEQALVREIKEELNTDITVGRFIGDVEYDYPKFHLDMQCFLCEIKAGTLELKEHEAAKWLSADEVYSVDWLPADIIVIPRIREAIKKYSR